MREKILNTLKITCDDLDFTTVSNIEFYVRQVGFSGCYTPRVVSSHEMVVTIPFEEAMKLRCGKAELQFAFTDCNGTPAASDVLKIDVDDLLKEEGYAPIQG